MPEKRAEHPKLHENLSWAKTMPKITARLAVGMQYPQFLEHPTTVDEARFMQMRPEEVEFRHVIEASRTERPAVTSEQIAEKNKEWARDTAAWIKSDSRSEEFANAMDRVFGVNVRNLNTLSDELEEMRSTYFDDASQGMVGGNLDMTYMVESFVYRYNASEEPFQAVAYQQVENELNALNKFLYVFGGEKTVARIHDAVLAAAALANTLVPTDDAGKATNWEIHPEGRAQLFKAIKDRVEEDITANNAELRYYQDILPPRRSAPPPIESEGTAPTAPVDLETPNNRDSDEELTQEEGK